MKDKLSSVESQLLWELQEAGSERILTLIHSEPTRLQRKPPEPLTTEAVVGGIVDLALRGLVTLWPPLWEPEVAPEWLTPGATWSPQWRVLHDRIANTLQRDGSRAGQHEVILTQAGLDFFAEA